MRQRDLLSPQQERFIAEAAAAMAAPFRQDFLTDVHSRLGELPSNAAVAAAVSASLDWFAARQQLNGKQQ